MDLDPETLLSQLAALDVSGRSDLMGAVAALPPAEAVACAFRVLAGLGPEHGTLVGMCCMQILAAHGAPGDRARLAALKPRLPPLPGLRDWRLEAPWADACMAARERGDCECVPRAKCDRPPDDTRFETLSERIGDWVVDHRLRCRRCGAEYDVRTEEGYHYPLFRWSKASATL